jgi:hypothetical protein
MSTYSILFIRPNISIFEKIDTLVSLLGTEIFVYTFFKTNSKKEETLTKANIHQPNYKSQNIA